MNEDDTNMRLDANKPSNFYDTEDKHQIALYSTFRLHIYTSNCNKKKYKIVIYLKYIMMIKKCTFLMT
jgi:hypothetical protein